ncbi:response regulator transcription factor [Flexithrix dorotheae]|uniref:response regulator transcription factor n=1 Tax=Flexithrix dorotheae TaxID=70993 RepID=UPI00036A2A21|nr:response regulator transcription factor [Flexithrix dorotheae]
MSFTRKKILLVEDDESLGFVVKDNLEMNGYEVFLEKDGISAWESFQKNKYHICLVDVMLPKMDGLNLVEKIRKVDQVSPIMFLTAKSLKEDKIAGFKLGCDDYLTKPFSIEELVFRIEAILKRTGNIGTKVEEKQIYQVGKIAFDSQNLTLTLNSKVIHNITKREGDLLKMLIQDMPNIVKREDILNQIWGDDDYFKGRSLDVFITRLRKYLKVDDSIKIENIHGVGFRLKIS